MKASALTFSSVSAVMRASVSALTFFAATDALSLAFFSIAAAMLASVSAATDALSSALMTALALAFFSVSAATDALSASASAFFSISAITDALSLPSMMTMAATHALSLVSMMAILASAATDTSSSASTMTIAATDALSLVLVTAIFCWMGPKSASNSIPVMVALDALSLALTTDTLFLALMASSLASRSCDSSTDSVLAVGASNASPLASATVDLASDMDALSSAPLTAISFFVSAVLVMCMASYVDAWSSASVAGSSHGPPLVAPRGISSLAPTSVTLSLSFIGAPPCEGKTRGSSGAPSCKDKARSAIVASFTSVFAWVLPSVLAVAPALTLRALRQARSGAPSSHRRFASRKASLANFFVLPAVPSLAPRSATQSSRFPNATALSARAHTAAFHSLEGLSSSSPVKKGILTRGCSLSPMSSFAVMGSFVLFASPAGAPPSKGKACWLTGAPPPEGEACLSVIAGCGSGTTLASISPSASMSPIVM
mmetsp:Transcript_32770/g.69816  ORF Transcript_32770/g.69816 Transcript_32770/m.69816 type:complete len:489 (+) Transcript_32770:2909-4375(+)